MNGKPLVVLVLTIAVLIGLGLLVTRTMNRDASPSAPTRSQTETNQSTTSEGTMSLPATIRTSSFTWQNQSQQEVEVLFEGDPNPFPTAFTLHLLFDPNILQVDSVEIGNLWTGENVLERKIDNEKGEVKFSAGQGFEDDITRNRRIATLKVRVVNADPEVAETSLTLGPESATASVGVDHLITLQAPSVTIKLSD